MSEPASELEAAGAGPAPTAADRLARELGIDPALAAKLVAAGYATPGSIRGLPAATLRELGVPPDLVARLAAAAEAPADRPPPRADEAAPAKGRPPVDGQAIIERWRESVRKTERPRRRSVALPAKDSTDVLKRWVEGDDRAMETWIQSSEAVRPPPPVEPAPAPVAPAPPLAPGGGDAAGPVPARVREREETVVRWLTDLLDRVKSEQFDPTSILQEVQDLHRQLFEERSRRKQLEDEIEHVKRGSIAVIKYVRSREAKSREQAVQAKDAEIADLKLRLLQHGVTFGPEGEPTEGSAPEGAAPATVPSIAEVERKLREEYAQREREYVERETELRRRSVQLETELHDLRGAAAKLHERESLLQQEASALPQALAERMAAFDQRERDLSRREGELRAKFEEITIGAEEIDRKRAPLAFKERELAAWEQQLQTQKQALELEARRIETRKRELPDGPPPSERADQLESLRADLTRKEEELQNRETLLHQKMEELEKLTQRAAGHEAEQMHLAAVQAASETKVPSGVRRLDDLLFGGFPKGSQVLVNGPVHTGKDVLTRLFAAEGLKAGVPTLWVVTDKTYTQIREEMVLLYPAYPEKEAAGMVRYVDLYSRSLGVTQAEPAVRLVSMTDKGAVDQLTTFTNQFTQDLKERFGSYRIVFESVSTITAYLDTAATFRFLQPFVGRRKMDGAAGYYLLETGMHTDADLQTLEHMMDGSVNLKIDQLKTFLSVKGIGDAQSRAWIGYTFSKRAFSLGSFSLDHIR